MLGYFVFVKLHYSRQGMPRLVYQVKSALIGVTHQPVFLQQG